MLKYLRVMYAVWLHRQLRRQLLHKLAVPKTTVPLLDIEIAIDDYLGSGQASPDRH